MRLCRRFRSRAAALGGRQNHDERPNRLVRGLVYDDDIALKDVHLPAVFLTWESPPR